MDDITRQITEAMKQYTGAVSEEIETALNSVGKEAAVKLKQTSPKRSGKYRKRSGKYWKGWTVSAERKNGEISVTVHNKNYRLTHLLEHGHKTRSGGRASAIPHIAPVEAWAEQEALKAVEKAVKG